MFVFLFVFHENQILKLRVSVGVLKTKERSGVERCIRDVAGVLFPCRVSYCLPPLGVFGFICSEGSDFRVLWVLLLNSMHGACPKMPSTGHNVLYILLRLGAVLPLLDKHKK